MFFLLPPFSSLLTAVFFLHACCIRSMDAHQLRAYACGIGGYNRSTIYTQLITNIDWVVITQFASLFHLFCGCSSVEGIRLRNRQMEQKYINHKIKQGFFGCICSLDAHRLRAYACGIGRCNRDIMITQL